VVDVVVGEVLQFLGGGAVQQGGEPDERFVRMHLGIGAPPSEQFALSGLDSADRLDRSWTSSWQSPPG
jgi:hypothetical protein